MRLLHATLLWPVGRLRAAASHPPDLCRATISVFHVGYHEWRLQSSGGMQHSCLSAPVPSPLLLLQIGRFLPWRLGGNEETLHGQYNYSRISRNIDRGERGKCEVIKEEDNG